MNSLGDGLIIAFYSIIFVLGLIGNCLIIFTTFKYRKRQSVMNVFMLSLASSDLLVIICIPAKVAKIISNVWEMGEIVCKGMHYIQNLFAICSVLTLAAISLERYYAIIHPMEARYICTVGKAKRIILGIWLLSPLLAIPSIILFVQIPFGMRNEHLQCVENINDNNFWRFHELYMIFLVLVIPFAIMIFSYAMICHELWGKIEERSVMTNQQALKRTVSMTRYKSIKSTKKYPTNLVVNQDKQMVKQITRKLITVVIVFAICWTPLLVVNVLTAFEIFFKVDHLMYLSIAFSLIAYSNSCLNPIVYGFMSKTFRRRFFALFKQSQIIHSHNQGRGVWLI